MERIQQQKEVDINSKMTRDGKPNTRLRKRAPAALKVADLRQTSNPLQDDNSPPVIPLLSPLYLSPPPPLLPEAKDNRETAQRILSSGLKVIGSGAEAAIGSYHHVESTGARLGTGAWQHPASEPMIDSSKVFALFQSHCAVVDRNS